MSSTTAAGRTRCCLFVPFAADIVAFAAENRPERFVFDVRENSGGDSRWFQQLLSELYTAFLAGRVPAPPAGVYGIIGKRTFSSGTLAARDMKQAGMILVGETTGGAFSGSEKIFPYVAAFAPGEVRTISPTAIRTSKRC